MRAHMIQRRPSPEDFGPSPAVYRPPYHQSQYLSSCIPIVACSQAYRDLSSIDHMHKGSRYFLLLSHLIISEFLKLSQLVCCGRIRYSSNFCNDRRWALRAEVTQLVSDTNIRTSFRIDSLESITRFRTCHVAEVHDVM